MAEVAKAWVSLLPSAKGFGSKLESEVGGDVKGSGKRLGAGFGKMFALAGGLVAAAGVGSLLKDSIEEAREAQKVGALTESIIKSTGGAAKVTAGQVGDLASAISLKTGMDDEAIQSGANMLLTFKNVRNEAGKGAAIFDRATQAATDLSAAGFGDMAGQSKMLGKALNDPIKGISALSRSGVTFTEQQKAQIKAMVESGDTLKAQKIILGEVESQVGGAAAATATAGEKASVAFGNLKEDLGTALLPAVDAAANAFVKMSPAISKGIGAIGPAFSAAKAYLSPFIADLRDRLAPAVERVRGALAAALPILVDLGTRAAAVIVPVLKQLGSALKTMLPPVVSLAKTIGAALMPILQRAGDVVVGTILPAFASLYSYFITSIVPVFTQVVGIVRTHVVPILATLATFVVGTLVPAVVGIVKTVGQKLKPVFDQLVATFRSQVLPTVQDLLAKFKEWQPTIQKVVMVVVKVVGAVLKFAAAILGKVLPPVIKFAGWLLSKLVPAITGTISVVARIIGRVIAFGAAVIDAGKKAAEFAKKVINTITGLKDKVVGALKGAGEWLLNAGRKIIDGLLAGLKEKWQAAEAWFKSITDKIPKLKGPPKKDGVLLYGAGRLIMEGFGRGLREGAVKPLEYLKTVAKQAVKNVKSQIEAFKSLRDAIKSAYSPDLFSSSPGMFGMDLKKQLAVNTSVIAAVKKLKGMNLNPAFLSGLIQSGNTGLITALAGSSASAVKSQQADWLAVQQTAGQLGTQTATAVVGKGLGELRTELQKLNKAVARLAKETGREVSKGVNKSASDGRRNGR